MSDDGNVVTVTALTSGPDTPSARFRVRQHIDPLARHRVLVNDVCPSRSAYGSRAADDTVDGVRRLADAGLRIASRLPGIAASRRSDVTWLERGLIPGWPTLEPLLHRPVVLDVDDAIWLSQPHGSAAARLAARRSAAILAGNTYIADWFSRFGSDIHVIPTAIDASRFSPGDSPLRSGRFTVGWTGSSSNASYLRLVERPLSRFLQQHDAEFLVVADAPPDLPLIPQARTRFVPWTRAVEVDAVRAMDVGLMPLPDLPWTRGKCAFKLLQYMACGVPFIASPTGMNQELIDLGGGFQAQDADWYDTLCWAFDHPSHCEEMGRAGRNVITDRFDVHVVAARIAAVLSRFSERRRRAADG
jgi:glycosyltransferase involved in cell wall biosynthesis